MAHNVDYVVKGDKLIITVDVGSKSVEGAPPSATGKTRLVASTSGSTPVAGLMGGKVSFSLNVMTK